MSYPLGEEVIDSLDLRVNISGLDPWRWYAVEVFAENEGGEGTHSNYVTVRTLPAGTFSNTVNKKRKWNILVLIFQRTAKAQVSLHIRAVLPEPSHLANSKYTAQNI